MDSTAEEPQGDEFNSQHNNGKRTRSANGLHGLHGFGTEAKEGNRERSRVHKILSEMRGFFIWWYGFHGWRVKAERPPAILAFRL